MNSISSTSGCNFVPGNIAENIMRTPEEIKLWAAAKLIESTLKLRKQQSGE